MDPNESVVNKMQKKYWITKQTVLRKLGKKEDECIVSSDSELDAKLELFSSIQQTTGSLLKIINRYQNSISALAVEENEMGSFMKEYGKIDETRAGKMMIAVGTSVSYTGQQRFVLRTPLDRLYQKLETFHRRAIIDTFQTIQKMEKSRTEYRAALNWMKDISQELDPDTYKHMERFKRVQEHVKDSKLYFDRLKAVCMTKIDVLAASRSNMFSNLLVLYEKSLSEFTEKCANTFTVIANSFKGYQSYDFCVLKELSDLKPDSPIALQVSDTNDDVKMYLRTYRTNGFLTTNRLLEFEEEIDEEKSGETKKDENLENSSVFSSLSTSEDLLSDFVFDATQPSNNIFLPSQLLSLQSISPNSATGSKAENLPTARKNSESSNLPTAKQNQNSWLDLFAELDPLSNPDNITKASNNQHKNC